jgi:hypothetical protein
MILQQKTILCGAALMLLAGTSGCQPELETGYGRAEDPGYRRSVNGTAALVDLVRQRGHQVFSWDQLSPSLSRRADVIVWFPDDPEAPRPEAVTWLERWLSDKPGRTLVYVLRDFDAEASYWARVRPSAPPDQQPLIDARLARAERVYRRNTIAQPIEHPWFRVAEPRNRRPVKELAGEPRWLAGLFASATQLELNSGLRVRRRAKILLRSGTDALVARQRLGEGRLILVANGSFLLNLPLLNHEHRKLAGKLIDELGPKAKTVAFLESSPGGPRVAKEEPAAHPPSGLALFGVWPLGWILAHVIALGMVFACSRWPIFGRPKTPETEPASDFGRHVAALAEHFRRTGDERYAQAQVDRYRGTQGLAPAEARQGADGAAV